MLFNSLEFLLFFPIIFILYWFVFNKNLRLQNALLLVSSYIFYAWWDYRFLFLLIFSTLLDYFTALQIEKSENENRRKFWFWLSITINLGFLGIFKYYNFFAESAFALLHKLGVHSDPWIIKVILPVGISFYTFHGLSYVIDIYKKRISAVRDYIEYAVFVSFFPLLVAGPIERATHLLPQIQRPRKFNYSQAADGMRQILWGLFKKVVIADNCAVFANQIFNDPGSYGGSTLVLGALFFTFQIYGDFSGYSDIALGTARIMGMELLRNFSFPYFSRDIAEFWRRWHISLSSWFRDYVYIPLGGSAGGLKMKLRNTFIIFLLSGFWHGANWTFIVWGAINAIYFLPLLLTNQNRNNLEIVAKGRWFPSIKETIQMLMTFVMTVFAWIFFRAKNLSEAFLYIKNIFTKSLFSIPSVFSAELFALIFLLFSVEWIQREQKHGLEMNVDKIPIIARWSIYLGLIFILIYFRGSEQGFIYFQF